jgi:hypothetical protein
MGRRIEIELTSKVDDETWTWRAAGAKQPKGTVASKLLYDGARVGDVVRAEVENDIDGIVVTLVMEPKEKRAEAPRLEILPPPERRPAPTERPDPRAKPERGSRPAARDRDRPPRGDRRERSDRPRPDRRTPRAAARPKPEPPPERPKPKRLNPGHAHRNKVLESLPPEQRPIAEQVVRGGIPAVRQAIDAQNAALKADNQAPIKAEPLLALAEEILPAVKAAEWRDRADAAAAAGDDVSLRDLRSVVTSADARDDESRLLARTLREALDVRLKAERETWLNDIGTALKETRVVRALRIASRPPDPAMRFPAELGAQLAEAASGAMSGDAPPDRWLAVLDAVSVSPVRRAVQPAGLPADPPEAFLNTVKAQVPRVPALGPLVGIEPTPTKPPAAPRVPPPPGPPGAPRIPPPPPRPPVPQRHPPGAAAPEIPNKTEDPVPAVDN